MRYISYKVLHATEGGKEKVSKSLDDFLLSLPHLFYFGYIPSLQTINLFLSFGLDEAGMAGGCEWHPFKVSPSEFDEIVSGLKSKKHLNGRPYDDTLINFNATSKEAWYSKVLECEWHVPFQQHLTMTLKANKLRSKSIETEDESLTMKLHLDWIKASEELQKFEENYKHTK